MRFWEVHNNVKTSWSTATSMDQGSDLMDIHSQSQLTNLMVSMPYMKLH